MSARLAVVVCGCLALADARRQAQDYEESIFDPAVDALCPPAANAAAVATPVISQFNATGVTVSNVAGADTVYLINTYGTAIALQSGPPQDGKMDWAVCWHKDVATNYHLASEAIESVRAVAHFPAPGCQRSMSAPLETWYTLVNAYESAEFDMTYYPYANEETTAPFTATESELDQMTPTLTTTITSSERTARVRMTRLANKPVPFLYVKDVDGRVLWMATFSDAEQLSTASYTSEEFAIPPLSTSLSACTTLSTYKGKCNTYDLTADIIGTFPASTSTLPADRGVYEIVASGLDKYKVTPLPEDYTSCPGTYMLYAEGGGATLGLSIGSPLTVSLDTSLATISVYLACPGATTKYAMSNIDLAAEKAAAPTDTGGSVSGNTGGTTALTCGEHADQDKWSCSQCDSGKCLCDAGLVVCDGSMSAGESLTMVESVGIAISVVVLVVIICGVAYFFYKKKQLTKCKSKDVTLETQPMADAEGDAPKTEQV